MKEIGTRILSGLTLIGLMVGAILYSVTAAQILFALIVFIATYEYFRMSKMSSPMSMTMSILSVAIYGMLILMVSPAMTAVKFLLYSTAILLCLLRLFSAKADSPFIARAHGLFVIAVPFAILADWLSRGSTTLVLSFYALIWVSDTMAYVCGRLFGKRKLMPSVSPAKTWEGFIGGVVFCMLVAFLGNRELVLMEDWQAILFGALLSISGSLGDLFESRFKRLSNVKDSGKIMPGHGGLLDRFDGLVISVPLLFIVFDYCLNLLL